MNSEKKDKQRRKALILSIVQNQMEHPDTPEVKTEYQRLRSIGHSDSEARELIATILTFQIWHKMRNDDYTYADFVAELQRLPEIDWERGESRSA